MVKIGGKATATMTTMCYFRYELLKCPQNELVIANMADNGELKRHLTYCSATSEAKHKELKECALQQYNL